MPKLQRVAFLVNPVAGSGRGWRAWEAIEPRTRELCEPMLLRTQSAREGVRLCRQAVSAGVDRVVALGGDGTLNEAVNGLHCTGVPLGIVPCGTGNDYAKSLRLPKDPAAALELALSAPARPVDLGETDSGQLFVNIAGVGFDAEVVRRYHAAGRTVRKLGGKMRYLAAVVGAFGAFRGVDAQFHLDGEAVEVRRMVLVAVGNGQYYGAGMHILPDASLHDGLFDIVWGAGLGRLALAGLLRGVYKAHHVGHPNLTFRRAVEVKVATKIPVGYQLDGDLAGETPVTFRSLPDAIKVVFP